MNLAKAYYEAHSLSTIKMKRANSLAIWSFVLAIATYPLVVTVVLALLSPVSLVVSAVFAVISLVQRTQKKGFAIAGLAIDALPVIVAIVDTVTK